MGDRSWRWGGARLLRSELNQGLYSLSSSSDMKHVMQATVTHVTMTHVTCWFFVGVEDATQRAVFFFVWRTPRDVMTLR